MKVSIIIPVYNSEKYLEECINSAINQTYTDTEIIAVYDNGSIDRSFEILTEYSNRIKIISIEHAVTPVALNTGITMATGEWIKQLDSDDVLYPNAVEELISESKKLKNKKNVILYSSYEYINSEGKTFGYETLPNYNNLDTFDFNVILLDHDIGLPTTTLIHKSTITENGFFDETIRFQEDYEFRLRCCLLHNCRLHLVEKTLVKYRIHKDQTTKRKIKLALEQGDKIRKSVLNKLNSLERGKYENALKHYRKNRPIIVKAKHFVKYNILTKLPTYVSTRIVLAYWYLLEKKHS